MAADEIHLNDIGTTFLITVQDASITTDISSAVTKQIIFRKPDGSILTVDGSFTTDGIDGKVQYSTVSGDLNQTGLWKLQVYLVFSGGSWKSDIQSFTVFPNLN